ncbi:hypothetical protein N836_03835 [Leptolyngbya sp. Heron Island J]|uniref:2TM domain-containing protein n=1 Tax=Leptolyngbya sp. Heron Island J TaxID=1385935 RepID=UPI0003B976DE|nr:2TM domain-containing protein [Leptolyngbya sp. Heron Island J]ESA37238.1 hypothetical protein N836_03835 [Leptolyngbya sp. Heron Island J]
MAMGYSIEEVQQILAQAMEQSQQEGFSRSQLEEMAADLGISPEALTLAEQHCQETSVQTTSTPASQRPAFSQQLRTYVVVNGFLLALNFSLSGTITWAIYPLLGWGMGLLLPKEFWHCGKAITDLEDKPV